MERKSQEPLSSPEGCSPPDGRVRGLRLRHQGRTRHSHGSEQTVAWTQPEREAAGDGAGLRAGERGPWQVSEGRRRHSGGGLGR